MPMSLLHQPLLLAARWNYQNLVVREVRYSPTVFSYSFLTILDATTTETTDDLPTSTPSFSTAQELPNTNDQPVSKKLKLDSRSSPPPSAQKIKQWSRSGTSTLTSAWKTKHDWLSASYPDLHSSRGLHGWRWCKCQFFCLSIDLLHHQPSLYYKGSCIGHVEEDPPSIVLLLCTKEPRGSYLLRGWQGYK